MSSTSLLDELITTHEVTTFGQSFVKEMKKILNLTYKNATGIFFKTKLDAK